MPTSANPHPFVVLAPQSPQSPDRTGTIVGVGRSGVARRWAPVLLGALLVTGACDEDESGDDGVAGTTTAAEGSGAPGSGDGDDTGMPADDGSGGGSANGDDSGDDDGAVTTTGPDDTAGDDTTAAGGSELPPGVFLADDEDYIVFDIESVAGDSPPDPWIFAQSGPCEDPADCEPLGDGYYQFKGANQCGQTQDHDAGVMEIEFEVKTAGMYRFAGRNLRDHTGDCENDRNNDSFVAFPSTLSDPHFREPFKVFGGGHGAYNWTNSYDIHDVGKARVCVEFEPGVHTMRLSGRSNNHAIDRVAIFRVEGDVGDCRNNGLLNGLDDRPVTGQSQ
ncbi:MAG: hypothetical protein AAGF11_27770 [Myxococcota bacterium]